MSVGRWNKRNVLDALRDTDDAPLKSRAKEAAKRKDNMLIATVGITKVTK